MTILILVPSFAGEHEDFVKHVEKCDAGLMNSGNDGDRFKAFRQVDHDVDDVLAGRGVEAGGRLVQHQDVRMREVFESN